MTKQKKIALIVGALVILLLIGLGGWFLGKGQNAPAASLTPTPTPSEIPTPTLTITPTIVLKLVLPTKAHVYAKTAYCHA
ncbi:hypothetical protein HY029_05080 [Candidatus Gottesmanbacteria bacterium]|nr:hypothetical protein [Candidatus Gottesmanbacteria bacterium]